MEIVPPLRPLEPIPVEVEEQQLVVLRDPFHYIKEDATVTVPIYMLLTLIDGTRTAEDIQQEFKTQFGGELSLDNVFSVINEIDEYGLLDNENFEAIKQKTLAEFRAEPVRRAIHAGSAYAGDAPELHRQIDDFFQRGKEPAEPLKPEVAKHIKGIVAPHIDPQVGGYCAAPAFRILSQTTPPPELFVLIGTAHQPTETTFILSTKDFETPLGTVRTDLETATRLNDACPMNLLHDEYAHKNEHSLEFQLIFLQHLFGGDRPWNLDAPKLPKLRKHNFQILPLLIGSFHQQLGTNTMPSQDEEMQVFTKALKEALDASGKRWCCVVGADLSHMGMKFGDERELSTEYMNETRALDVEMLRHVVDMRQEDFFHHLQSTHDQQKVCGFPPIYTMMNLLDPDNHAAELLAYDLHPEKQTQSFVSFASLAFYKKESTAR